MASGMMAEPVTPVRKRASVSMPAIASALRAQQSAGGDAGDRHDRHLAVAVAERAVHQHEDAVGEQEGGRRDRGPAHRDAEFAAELDQQRVDHAHVGGRGEGRHRQKDNSQFVARVRVGGPRGEAEGSWQGA